MRLTKKDRRVGREWRDGEILDGEIEREISGRSILVAEKSQMRVELMLFSSILLV
jgi:hypothetical protein